MLDFAFALELDLSKFEQTITKTERDLITSNFQRSSESEGISWISVISKSSTGNSFHYSQNILLYQSASQSTLADITISYSKNGRYFSGLSAYNTVIPFSFGPNKSNDQYKEEDSISFTIKNSPNKVNLLFVRVNGIFQPRYELIDPKSAINSATAAHEPGF
jgi:hypothetical protein